MLEYDEEKEFFSEMSETMFLNFKDDINQNGIFDSHKAAKDFAKYCNYINTKHNHCIESEDNWRPFAIYSCKT